MVDLVSGSGPPPASLESKHSDPALEKLRAALARTYRVFGIEVGMAGKKIALAMIMLSLGGTAMASEPDPSGTWMRGDGNAKVRIAPCGANICATNQWIKDTSGGENVGDKLVMTVKPKSADTLSGKAFDPKRNLTYSIQVTVKKSALVTRGCIVGGLLCKNVNWSRVP
jgi:uncharacterized protein (DUF2147 family)